MAQLSDITAGLRRWRFLIRCLPLLWVGVSAAAVSLPFPVGEELVYSITWNGIPVAWSRAVTEMEVYEEREVLALRLYTKTYPFFDRIFKVDDLHETLVDLQTGLPLRYTQNLNEGRYHCHEITVFDFETLTAHYEHQVSGKTKVYDLQSGVRDILSFMYFLRAAPLQESSTNRYSVMTDEKIYELILTTFKEKRVSLPRYSRKIPALELKPEALFDGLFVRKGKATVWVSKDPRRLMVRAGLNVPFGRVNVTLQEVRGPGDDFWITEKKNGDETDNKTDQGDF